MAKVFENDLTVVYITANQISDYFMSNMQRQLVKATSAEIISVSKQPVEFGGQRLIFGAPRSHVNIYREALEGVKLAQTKYIAIAEDDVLYSPEHFKKRPSSGKFGYNISCWRMYTWAPEVLSHPIYGGRHNHGMLICERNLYIEAMEERFKKFEGQFIDKNVWAEPGKYEKHLGVTVRETEDFYTNPPNIMFSHNEGLSAHTLGSRKRLGELRATELPYWGKAETIIKEYR